MASGGNIGRSSDNDLGPAGPAALLCPRNHARIHFRDGLYILEDTSTNGVYVNDEDRPVSKRGAHVLQNGDIIRFGEYQVVAMVEARGAAAGAPTAAGPEIDRSGPFRSSSTSSVEVHTTAQSVEVLAAFAQGAQTDLGASLDLDALLSADAEDFHRPLAVNAYGQPVAQAHYAPPTPAPAPPLRPLTPAPLAPSASELSASLADSETERRAIARRIERLARAASRAQDRRIAASAPVPPDANSGLSAFCRGAGIAVDHFAPDLQVRLLNLAGQLIREALLGLKDLERVRTQTLQHMQVQTPDDTDDPRPSLARAGIEDLLVQILSQHESRRLDAVQWLREAIERAKTHDRATFDAMRTAFSDFVARLEPTELESRFGRNTRVVADTGARNWELYSEFYRSIAARTDAPLPRVFLDAFGVAYDENLHKPER